jgi:hypothetical protein
MNIINLTPHSINVKVGESLFTYEPSGDIARVKTETKVVFYAGEIQVVKTTFSAVEGLPEPHDDTLYLVSSIVAQAAKGRSDVVAPDTGATAIRENGQVVAVRGFQQF